jgi:peptide-methionine (S)-S-oxide reductase
MTETATFAAGCFWGVEAAFRRIEGVQRTRVGYTGGHVDDPTYEDVCSHGTGHAEAVEVEFDPEQVSYDELLDAFWAEHDPTQVNRQGWDFGDQYRTEIFVHSPEQEAAAIASRDREQARRRKPIATKITPAETFWPAEEYHQRYLEKRGRATCAAGVADAETAQPSILTRLLGR